MTGAYTGFQKGGFQVTVKYSNASFSRAHMHSVFFLLYEVWGSPKGGGVPDPQDPPPQDPPLDEIVTWCKLNRLTINTDKIKAMVIAILQFIYAIST